MAKKKQDNEEAEIPTDRDVAEETAKVLKLSVDIRKEVIENILKDMRKDVEDGINIILGCTK